MEKVEEEAEEAKNLDWIVRVKDENTLILTVPYKIRDDIVEKMAKASERELLEILEKIEKWIAIPPRCYWLCPNVYWRNPDRLGQIINIKQARAYIDKLKEVSELVNLREVISEVIP